jgi:hypothetical protein
MRFVTTARQQQDLKQCLYQAVSNSSAIRMM